MAKKSVDNNALAFPVVYCNNCRSPIIPFISRVGDRFIQLVNCQVCQSFYGIVESDQNSIIAKGEIVFEDYSNKMECSWVLHNPQIKEMIAVDVTVWIPLLSS